MKKLLSICLKGFLVLIASMFLMQGVARAHLYGVSYGDSFIEIIDTFDVQACELSRLYLLDPNTGQWTRVGDIRGESNSDDVIGYWGVEGIDFHPVTGELFAIGYRCADPDKDNPNPYLLTLDPCTGFVTNEEDIDIEDLEDDFIKFTDISFQSDGTLFAFYLFMNDDVPPNPEGAVATIDLDNGDAEAVGEGTGNIDIQGGGIAFLYGDPNNGTLWQAESSTVVPFAAELNELDPDDGDIEDSDDLEFHSPIADGDFPTVNAMDSQPGTGMLYAAISFDSLTQITAPTEQWWYNNYLATVDEDTGDVKVVGGTIWDIEAIAFAPLPVADAGTDIIVEQTSHAGAVVCLDGSGSDDYIDCCGDPLLYIWDWTEDTVVERLLYGKTPCAVFPLGPHEVNLTVDNCNGTDYATVLVTVRDTTKPIITCLPDIVVEQTSHAGTTVDPNDPAVFDLCDPNVTVEGIADPNHQLPYTFPLGGPHTITWTATDASGNTAVCTQNVTVVDRTDPVITSVTATPNTLSPSLCGLLHEVTVQVDANDICDSAPTCKIISVSSNQTGSRYSFFKEPDWFITGANTVLLRAKNDLFSMDNRIYTITVECTDDSGNSSTAYTTVEVKYSWSWDPILDPNTWSTDRVRRLPNRDRRLPRRSRR